MKKSFFAFYSAYEIRMTKYVEANINTFLIPRKQIEPYL